MENLRYRSTLNTWIKKLNKKKINIADESDLKWVVDNYLNIFHIIDEYPKESTRRTYYNIMASVVKPLSKPVYKITAKRAAELREIVLAEEIENVIPEGSNEEKNYVTRDMIEKVLTIMKDYTTDAENIAYLTILCYYYFPMRREWSDMYIWDGKGNPPDDINYFFYEGDDAYVMINKDKVSKHAHHSKLENKKTKVNYELEKKVNNYFLDEINRSLRDYPREYVLSETSNPDKPLGYQKMLRVMKNAFKFMGREPGIDIFRSSFVSYYHKRGLIQKDLNTISKIMRNSTLTQNTNYYKYTMPQVDENTMDEQIEKKRLAANDENEKLKQEIEQMNEPKTEQEVNRSKYNKRYYKANKDKFNKEKTLEQIARKKETDHQSYLRRKMRKEQQKQ